MDRLVVAKSGITTYGRYVQALRELYGRYRAIRECLFEVEELTIDVDAANLRVASGDEIERRRALLERKRKRAALSECESRLNGVCYEFTRYFLNALALKKVLGPLNQESVEGHERELMLAQVRKSIADDCLNGRMMTPRTWNLVCALVPADRQTAMGWVADAKTEAVAHFLDMPEPVGEIEPTDEQVSLLRGRVTLLIEKNPELNYGAHTYQRDGLPQEVHRSV